jgi:hypothetical protein
MKDEALWPTPRLQGGFALGQRSVPFHEFAQTHALLELNLVLLHRRSPRVFGDASISGHRLMD